jgi:prepilin-type processing-associated H-X9-DG protein
MYANDNRDRYPDPVALGDAPGVEFAWAFRRGINEPDPANPAVVETKGLHNVLFRGKYLPATGTWICPSNGGRNTLLAERNSYAWNVSRTNASWTSKQRGTPPLLNGVRSEKDWWYVQDNVFYAVRATDVASTSTAVSSTNPYAPTTPQSLNNWYMPHLYKTKRVNAQDNRARQGSTNVLFLDGSTGMFVYTPTSGFAPAEVVRGQ